MQITGGIYNSRKIKTPDYENIKPTLSKTRQGIFNTLAAMIDFENKIFMDMYAGSGIMSLEALSRGFKPILFEKDKKTAIAIKESFRSLGLQPEIYFGDSIKNINKTVYKADVVYIDPPYESDLYEKTLNALVKNDKLNRGAIIILEHPIEKQINTAGFKLIKAKTYGNKQISYFNQAE